MKWILIIFLALNINVSARSLNLKDYRKSCHQGNVYACQAVAKKYWIYQNKPNARRYMWKACELDVPGTCRIAKIYKLLNG